MAAFCIPSRRGCVERCTVVAVTTVIAIGITGTGVAAIVAIQHGAQEVEQSCLSVQELIFHTRRCGSGGPSFVPAMTDLAAFDGRVHIISRRAKHFVLTKAFHRACDGAGSSAVLLEVLLQGGTYGHRAVGSPLSALAGNIDTISASNVGQVVLTILPGLAQLKKILLSVRTYLDDCTGFD